MTDVKIRKAKMTDLEKVTKMCIELAVHLKEFQQLEYRKDFSKAYYKRIKNHLSDDKNFILIAESKNDVIGVLVGSYLKLYDEFKEKKFGYIEDIIVSPNKRGLGIGKKLINETGKIFKKNNANYFYLHSYPKNSESMDIYKKLGFEEFELSMVKKI